MGHEFVEMKNTPAATQVYRIAVDINPNDYRAWYEHRNTGGGGLRSAVPVSCRLTSHPACYGIRYGLGQTYELLRMFNYALDYYRKAAALRPFDSRMWCALGGCYEELGRSRDALSCYRRATVHDDK